jgi:hypothetical protein
MSLITLERLIEKVNEALPSGGWMLRRIASSDGSQRTWRAHTTLEFEAFEVCGKGNTPHAAVMVFLSGLLEYEQARGQENEATASASRDRIARVQRAIETL